MRARVPCWSPRARRAADQQASWTGVNLPAARYSVQAKVPVYIGFRFIFW